MTYEVTGRLPVVSLRYDLRGWQGVCLRRVFDMTYAVGRASVCGESLL